MNKSHNTRWLHFTIFSPAEDHKILGTLCTCTLVEGSGMMRTYTGHLQGPHNAESMREPLYIVTTN